MIGFSLCLRRHFIGINSDYGWLHKYSPVDHPFIEESMPDRYLVSLYYVMTTLASVGYGDILPCNQAGAMSLHMHLKLLSCAYTQNTRSYAHTIHPHTALACIAAPGRKRKHRHNMLSPRFPEVDTRRDSAVPQSTYSRRAWSWQETSSSPS